MKIKGESHNKLCDKVKRKGNRVWYKYSKLVQTVKGKRREMRMNQSEND